MGWAGEGDVSELKGSVSRDGAVFCLLFGICQKLFSSWLCADGLYCFHMCMFESQAFHVPQRLFFPLEFDSNRSKKHLTIFQHFLESAKNCSEVFHKAWSNFSVLSYKNRTIFPRSRNPWKSKRRWSIDHTFQTSLLRIRMEKYMVCNEIRNKLANSSMCLYRLNNPTVP